MDLDDCQFEEKVEDMVGTSPLRVLKEPVEVEDIQTTFSFIIGIQPPSSNVINIPPPLSNELNIPPPPSNIVDLSDNSTSFQPPSRYNTRTSNPSIPSTLRTSSVEEILNNEGDEDDRVVEIPNPTDLPQKKKRRLILDDNDEMTDTNVEENLECIPPKEASIKKKKKKKSRSRSRNRDTPNLIEMEPPPPNPIEVPTPTLSIIQSNRSNYKRKVSSTKERKGFAFKDFREIRASTKEGSSIEIHIHTKETTT
jgi:hypothetical protein